MRDLDDGPGTLGANDAEPRKGSGKATLGASGQSECQKMTELSDGGGFSPLHLDPDIAGTGWTLGGGRTREVAIS